MQIRKMSRFCGKMTKTKDIIYGKHRGSHLSSRSEDVCVRANFGYTLEGIPSDIRRTLKECSMPAWPLWRLALWSVQELIFV